MNIAEARRLLTYTEWANARFVETIRNLSEEQLDREIVSSFPSIRATLGHIVSAEWVWLRRWKGESPPAIPAWATDGSLDAIVTVLTDVERERREMLATLSDAGLDRVIAYRTIKGDPFENPLAELIRHVANHSTYHRGQLTTMIRQVGGIPPSTDYSAWFRGPS